MAYDPHILQNLNLSYCVKVVNFGSQTGLIIPGFPQVWDKKKTLRKVSSGLNINYNVTLYFSPRVSVRSPSPSTKERTN